MREKTSERGVGWVEEHKEKKQNINLFNLTHFKTIIFFIYHVSSPFNLLYLKINLKELGIIHVLAHLILEYPCKIFIRENKNKV